MTALQWFAILAVVGYGGVLVALYLMQRAIMYPAPQVERTAPAAAGFAQAQEILVDTADGEKAIAWHVPPRDGKPVALFFHGMAKCCPGACRVSSNWSPTAPG